MTVIWKCMQRWKDLFREYHSKPFGSAIYPLKSAPSQTHYSNDMTWVSCTSLDNSSSCCKVTVYYQIKAQHYYKMLHSVTGREDISLHAITLLITSLPQQLIHDILLITRWHFYCHITLHYHHTLMHYHAIFSLTTLSQRIDRMETEFRLKFVAIALQFS